MNHIKQGKAECQLATIAMVAGKTLPDIIRLALRIARIRTGMQFDSWLAFIDHCKGKRIMGIDIFDDVVESFMVKYRIPMVRGIAGDYPGSIKHTYLDTPDLSGRGQITVDGPFSTCHAVAYENGIVFDPDKDGPLPWHNWWPLMMLDGYDKYLVSPQRKE